MFIIAFSNAEAFSYALLHSHKLLTYVKVQIAYALRLKSQTHKLSTTPHPPPPPPPPYMSYMLLVKEDSRAIKSTTTTTRETNNRALFCGTNTLHVCARIP